MKSWGLNLFLEYWLVYLVIPYKFWYERETTLPATLVLYVPDHTILRTQICLVDGSPENTIT